jgi:hypothetical protein
MYHVFCNIRALRVKVSEADRRAIYAAADAPTRDEARKWMKKLSELHPRAHKYLCDLAPGMHSWSQWAIVEKGFSTFGTKTSNVAENNNSWLGILLMSSDPVTAYYLYMLKLLKRFEEKRNLYRNKPLAGLEASVQERVTKNGRMPSSHEVILSYQYVTPKTTVGILYL